ncbi:MAG: ATP-binding cassette domain-containing protein, partial [Pseudomonadota bacterium]|nr:ATP-binding cassette domain-containing protein [Pseudomonadota bacterium]
MSVATEDTGSDAALELRDLQVHVASRRLLGPLDIILRDGECLGLVGESGSGKSVCALAMLGLLPPGLRAQGRLRAGGRDIALGSPAHA